MKKFIFILLFIILVFLSYIFLQSKYSSDDTLTIKTPSGDVPVKNFNKNPVEVNPQGTVLIKRTSDYDIVSFAGGKSFLITLSRKPVAAARERAQNDFIETLGITKEQTCQLTVSLKIPGFVDLDLAGKDYHLSFCPNGIPFSS